MKLTKKSIAVLLSLLLLLSLGAIAFAAGGDDYDWVPIKTVKDVATLQPGDYYLDFTDLVSDPSNPQSVNAANIAPFHDGEWFVDLAQNALKGTVSFDGTPYAYAPPTTDGWLNTILCQIAPAGTVTPTDPVVTPTDPVVTPTDPSEPTETTTQSEPDTQKPVTDTTDSNPTTKGLWETIKDFFQKIVTFFRNLFKK